MLRFARVATYAGLMSVAVNAVIWQNMAAQCDAPHTASLSKDEFRPFSVVSVRNISPDSKVLTVRSPDGTPLGLNAADVVVAQAPPQEEGGKPRARPYSPVSSPSTEKSGHTELLVKGYETGFVSKYLVGLKPGDEVKLKGPLTKFRYRANTWREIGMLAGGTGIAPMIQVIRAILENPEDLTKVHLVCSHRREEDILMREEIDAMAASSNGRLRVTYVLTAPEVVSGEVSWDGVRGRINEKFIRENMPAPAEDIAVFVCGTRDFLVDIAGAKGKKPDQGPIGGMLKEIGYTSDMVFKF